MVIYGEQFVYGRVILTARQQRLVEARETAARRERQGAHRWAAMARAMVAARRQPVAMEDPEEDLLSVENERHLLLQRGQEEALAQSSGSVQVVTVTLHWPLMPVTDVALRLMPRSSSGNVTVRGVLVPYSEGVRPVWWVTGVDQYLERSMALIRFYDFAMRRRETAARRGAISLAELRALDNHLHQRDAWRWAEDARWLAFGMVRGVLRAVPFLCSAAFPAGRDVQDWVADCRAHLPRPYLSDE
ncbi:hypothetical protein E2C01_049552 [Portunus trituberculatus]|uniref:Uncharacterized protein n=1 Tax=Portunus trituberculatus TaxID=210409 RepID=A0A5B7GDF5_PORTR|nr:hypothetical protein [Portunus trituberculatus]